MGGGRGSCDGIPGVFGVNSEEQGSAMEEWGWGADLEVAPMPWKRDLGISMATPQSLKTRSPPRITMWKCLRYNINF